MSTLRTFGIRSPPVELKVSTVLGLLNSAAENRSPDRSPSINVRSAMGRRREGRPKRSGHVNRVYLAVVGECIYRVPYINSVRIFLNIKLHVMTDALEVPPPPRPLLSLPHN